MLCDRILVIHEGKLVEERTLSELQNELRQFVLVFESEKEPQMNADVRRWDGTWRAAFATKEDLIAGLEAVQKAGAKVLDVVAQEGSLENYFVETVRRAA